jgi:hypothetical protein
MVSFILVPIIQLQLKNARCEIHWASHKSCERKNGFMSGLLPSLHALNSIPLAASQYEPIGIGATQSCWAYRFMCIQHNFIAGGFWATRT